MNKKSTQWDFNDKIPFQALTLLASDPTKAFTSDEINESLSDDCKDPNAGVGLKRRGFVEASADAGPYKINQKGINELKRIKTEEHTQKFLVIRTLEWLKDLDNDNDPRKFIWNELRLTTPEMSDLRTTLTKSNLISLGSTNWHMKITTIGLALDYSNLKDDGLIKTDAEKIKEWIGKLAIIPIIAASMAIIKYLHDFLIWFHGLLCY